MLNRGMFAGIFADKNDASCAGHARDDDDGGGDF
jgi:hypothetical protein